MAGQHFRSQVGQDRWLHDNVFKGQRHGVFVDVGAHGEEGSNTWFFEKALGWTGLCIEANPACIPILNATRKGVVLNCAVLDEPGERPFLQITGTNVQLSGLVDHYSPAWASMLEQQRQQQQNRQAVINVKCRRLQDILDEHAIRRVDYLSIDTEGSEMAVLRSVEWGRMDIRALTVEDNHATGEAARFLSQHGYVQVHRIYPDSFFVHAAHLPKELGGTASS